MFIRYFFSFLPWLVAGLLIANKSFAQTYVGLGVSAFSLSSDYSSVDGRNTTGFTIFGGTEITPTWDAELSVSAASDIKTGPTLNIYYPADSAEYSVLRISIRKSFWSFPERPWVPWVSVGSTYHYINWNTYFYQLAGSGVTLGAGIDFEHANPWRFRVQALSHRFSAYDNYDYGPFNSQTREISAGVIYVFH